MIDFDARAKGWDAEPVKIERARAVAAAIRAKVPLAATMTALEYGSGTGLVSFALQPFLGHITLADSSAGMLAVIEEKLAASGIENMRPFKLDLLTDPLPAERFDLIYTLMTLHHVADTDRILRIFLTLLNRRGFLGIADLDREDGSFHGPEFTGHKGFDRQELAAKLIGAGFRAVQSATVYNLDREINGKPHDFPIFLAVAEKY